METREVFRKSSYYGNEIKKKRIEMENLAKKCVNLWDECNHEIVFKYNDDHPRKLIIDGYYFCPACGQTIECIQESDLSKSAFKESKVIPLTNLSLIATKETYSEIRNEVFYNFDFYYDKDIPVEYKEEKMESVLKRLEVKHDQSIKTLMKARRIKGKKK